MLAIMIAVFSHIEAEIDDVAGLNDILLAFEPELSRRLSAGMGTAYISSLYSLKASSNCRNEVGLYFSKLSSST